MSCEHDIYKTYEVATPNGQVLTNCSNCNCIVGVRDMAEKARISLADPDLDDLLLFWQDRLKVSDWTIDFQVIPYTEFKGNTADATQYEHDTVASTEYWLNRRRAIMRIADPETVPKTRVYVPEETLVHELLHLLLAPCVDHEMPVFLEEWACNALANALLDTIAREP